MSYLIALLVAVLVLGLVFGVVMWGIKEMSLPPPFRSVAIGLLCLIMVVLLLGLLFGAVPMPWYHPVELRPVR